jgi:PAS domain S-box-containing protein
MRLTADAGALGLWTWDPVADCVEPENDRAYEIFGLRPTGNALNAACLVSEYLHEEDVAAFERAAAATLHTGKPFFFQGRIYRHPDRELRWVELNGRLQPAADRRPAHIVGTTADITPRKQAEEQERQAVAAAFAAAEASAKFRTFFEQGAGFAGVLTLDGTVIEVNRFSLEASGFRREEIIGKKFWECGWWTRSQNLVDLVQKGVAQAVAGRAFRIETPYFVADGRQRVVDMMLSPVTDEAGRVLYVAPTGIDITDRKRSERELQRLATDLAEANRNKTEFLAVLAHELRNPLAPIRNGLEILRAAHAGEAMTAQVGDMMARQISHLARLIDDLLDIARISSGKVTLKKTPVTLGRVINLALETSLPAIEGAGHELTVQVRDDTMVLDADPGRLSQVIGNLLNNAAKYTPRGGHIELSTHQEGEHVVITVADDGAGIAAENLPRIFGLFHQEDRNKDRAEGGLGVGLSLVRRLVELHGGVVTAESAGPGKGSTFTVRLPLGPQTWQGQSKQNGSAAPSGSQSLRVLIVDDNVDAALSLSLLLQQRGHITAIAHDGREALEESISFQPEVVFLDLGMPVMNGYDVARQLRKTPGLENVPCVALTGWGSQNDRARCREAGIERLLTKPAQIEEIDRVLSELAE